MWVWYMPSVFAQDDELQSILQAKDVAHETYNHSPWIDSENPKLWAFVQDTPLSEYGEEFSPSDCDWMVPGTVDPDED